MATRKSITVKQFLRDKKFKNMGTVEKIVVAAKKGFSQKEIIEAGFNKNTVYRQVREQVTMA